MTKLPFTEAEYLEQMKAAFNDATPGIQINMAAHDAFFLVTLLQFAQRGLPDSQGFMKDVNRRLGREFQRAVVTVTNAQIGEMMETGWNPQFDVNERGEFVAEAEQNTVEVHNRWTLYYLNPDGSETDTPLACAMTR